MIGDLVGQVKRICSSKGIECMLNDVAGGESNLPNHMHVATVSLESLRQKLFPIRSKTPGQAMFADAASKLGKLLNRAVDVPQELGLFLEVIIDEEAGDFGMLNPDNVVRIVALEMFDAEGIPSQVPFDVARMPNIIQVNKAPLA
jgi:hypothetical protein